MKKDEIENLIFEELLKEYQRFTPSPSPTSQRRRNRAPRGLSPLPDESIASERTTGDAEDDFFATGDKMNAGQTSEKPRSSFKDFIGSLASKLKVGSKPQPKEVAPTSPSLFEPIATEQPNPTPPTSARTPETDLNADIQSFVSNFLTRNPVTKQVLTNPEHVQHITNSFAKELKQFLDVKSKEQKSREQKAGSQLKGKIQPVGLEEIRKLAIDEFKRVILEHQKKTLIESKIDELIVQQIDESWLERLFGKKPKEDSLQKDSTIQEKIRQFINVFTSSHSNRNVKNNVLNWVEEETKFDNNAKLFLTQLALAHNTSSFKKVLKKIASVPNLLSDETKYYLEQKIQQKYDATTSSNKDNSTRRARADAGENKINPEPQNVANNPGANQSPANTLKEDEFESQHEKMTKEMINVFMRETKPALAEIKSESDKLTSPEYAIDYDLSIKNKKLTWFNIEVRRQEQRAKVAKAKANNPAQEVADEELGPPVNEAINYEAIKQKRLDRLKAINQKWVGILDEYTNLMNQPSVKFLLEKSTNNGYWSEFTKLPFLIEFIGADQSKKTQLRTELSKKVKEQQARPEPKAEPEPEEEVVIDPVPTSASEAPASAEMDALLREEPSPPQKEKATSESQTPSGPTATPAANKKEGKKNSKKDKSGSPAIPSEPAEANEIAPESKDVTPKNAEATESLKDKEEEIDLGMMDSSSISPGKEQQINEFISSLEADEQNIKKQEFDKLSKSVQNLQNLGLAKETEELKNYLESSSYGQIEIGKRSQKSPLFKSSMNNARDIQSQSQTMKSNISSVAWGTVSNIFKAKQKEVLDRQSDLRKAIDEMLGSFGAKIILPNIGSTGEAKMSSEVQYRRQIADKHDKIQGARDEIIEIYEPGLKAGKEVFRKADVVIHDPKGDTRKRLSPLLSPSEAPKPPEPPAPSSEQKGTASEVAKEPDEVEIVMNDILGGINQSNIKDKKQQVIEKINNNQLIEKLNTIKNSTKDKELIIAAEGYIQELDGFINKQNYPLSQNITNIKGAIEFIQTNQPKQQPKSVNESKEFREFVVNNKNTLSDPEIIRLISNLFDKV